jgi:hypothetical protein
MIVHCILKDQNNCFPKKKILLIKGFEFGTVNAEHNTASRSSDHNPTDQSLVATFFSIEIENIMKLDEFSTRIQIPN